MWLLMAEASKFDDAGGNTKTVRHRIKAGALRMVDTRNRHLCDNKAPFSGLDENLDAEAKAFLGDIDSFQ